MTPARRGQVALAATLAIQMYTSLAAAAAAVLAPAIAPAFGIAPRWIGAFVGIVYAGAMVASLASGGFIERFGSIRVSQACVLVCSLGAAVLALAPEGAAMLLPFAALLIGLGYGPITPASSHLLIRTAPPARMALTFSIKQTGVPAGAALAGAVLPGIALYAGWRAAMAITAAIGVAIALGAQSVRGEFDAARQPGRRLTPAGLTKPLGVVRRTPRLLELALLSLAYSSVQVSLVSFLVVYLHETLGWSLVAAGLALTVATLGGVAGRIVWGAVADRLIAPRRVLALVGLAASACGALVAAAGPQWPPALLLAVAAVFGATAIGWNGVQLAEVARHAPPGSVGSVTGAAGFLTFAGVCVGPTTFAILATFAGGYGVGFATFAAVSGLAGASMLRTAAVRGSGAAGDGAAARERNAK